MNPFSWLRKSIAESVAAGFHDGLAQVRQDLTDTQTPQRLSVEAAVELAGPEQTDIELLPDIDPGSAAPLAAFVQQLGIGTGRTGPGLPSPASPEVRRKPGRPRKHNHEPS